MKLKVLLVVMITALLVFLIYLNSKDTKVYYLALGDYLINERRNGYTELIKKDLKNRKKLETYVSEFNKDEDRITDLINHIEENQTIEKNKKTITIKNALIKADLILVSIGSNDLFYKLEHNPALTETLYERVDEILNDSEILYQMIRKYSKEKILATGFYNPYSSEYDELIHYANERLKKVLKEQNITYIDINSCVIEVPERLEEKLTNSENECVYRLIMKEID